MSIIHFVCSPLQLESPNLKVGPEGVLKGHLSNKYTYTYSMVPGHDYPNDPRRVYEIDISDSHTTEEKDKFKALFFDATAGFKAVEKTITEAEAIVEEITGDSYSQSGGKLVWDDEPT